LEGNKMDLSIVIPYIHEYPALIHTIYAIRNELSDENYTYEIIVVENGEKDPYTPTFLSEMWPLTNPGILKYAFEPIPCGPLARNHGAKKAKGKYLMFTDAHIIPQKNTLPLLLGILEDNSHVGMSHGVTRWMGRFDKYGYHYRLDYKSKNWPSIFTHFHGGYTHEPAYPHPYPIVNATLAYVAFRTKEFLDLRGYHPHCQYYPHPEGYLPLKYWMFDKECWIHPDAIHYHSVYKKVFGPEYKIPFTFTIPYAGNPNYILGKQGHVIRNAMICAYTLGGIKWINYIHEGWKQRGEKIAFLDAIKKHVLSVAQEEHSWIMATARHTLDQTLTHLQLRKVPGMEGFVI